MTRLEQHGDVVVAVKTRATPGQVTRDIRSAKSVVAWTAGALLVGVWAWFRLSGPSLAGSIAQLSALVALLCAARWTAEETRQRPVVAAHRQIALALRVAQFAKWALIAGGLALISLSKREDIFWVGYPALISAFVVATVIIDGRYKRLFDEIDAATQ